MRPRWCVATAPSESGCSAAMRARVRRLRRPRLVHKKNKRVVHRKGKRVVRRYLISWNSPSGGTNEMVRSMSNLPSLTHWWKDTSSISMPEPGRLA